jgi:hypothetical protein
MIASRANLELNLSAISDARIRSVERTVRNGNASPKNRDRDRS